MKLYLMQHALAYPAEENQERPLNPAGISQAKEAAHGIKKLNLSFDLIISSPKRRAQQTAALIAEGVRYPYSDLMTTEAALPGQPPQAILDLIHQEPADSQILVVGHLPQLAKLASELLQGGSLMIENAGLSCFAFSEPESAQLEFHLKAAQLAR